LTIGGFSWYCFTISEAHTNRSSTKRAIKILPTGSKKISNSLSHILLIKEIKKHKRINHLGSDGDKSVDPMNTNGKLVIRKEIMETIKLISRLRIQSGIPITSKSITGSARIYSILSADIKPLQS
jgi:hypothetical protein